MKKIQQLGHAMTREEMKTVSGGIPPKTLWKCWVDGSWFAQVCYSVQPQPICGYGDSCIAIGSCNALYDLCIY